MKTRTLLLLGCAIAFATGHAETTKREMWVWKDANGVTQYSDKPAPGAKRIEIVGSTPVPTSSPPTPVASVPPVERAEKREYQALEFVEPEKDATFFGPDTEVHCSLRVAPGIMEGDELTWYLDGNRVEDAANASSYTFKNLPRGTHTVVAVIRNADGEEMIRALSRSFTVRQEAMNNPRNVGPALKPKPVPAPAPAPAPAPPPKSNK